MLLLVCHIGYEHCKCDWCVSIVFFVTVITVVYC